MGQFDKQIAEARKIGADWISNCDDYTGQFVTLKKNNVKWEKDAIGQLQAAIQAGGGNPQHQLSEIDVIKERLDQFQKEGERLYKQFDDWALKGPRSGMEPVDKKLKLGGKDSAAYDAVKVGIKTQLTEVASAISNTQRSWNNDLSVVIANQRTRVAALEKIVKGEAPKAKAFLDQLKTSTTAFEKDCERIFVALKLEKTIGDINKVLKDELKVKADAPPQEAKNRQILNDQMYHLIQEREKVIPSLAAQVTKNYGRVIKSVPPTFADQFVASGVKKQLDQAHKKALDDLTFAAKAFASARKQFEDRKLV